MQKLSAVIITKNEQTNLPRCLAALNWVDEIIVMDSGSTDNTLQIAHQTGCQVFTTPWLGFGKVKQLAVDKATNNWVLVVDADEVITPALQQTIKQVLANPAYVAYRILRKSFYLGKLINYSGWQKDYTLRLFDRTQAAFNDKAVHESVQTTKPIGHIKQHMLHYTYPTLSSHLQKIDAYTTIQSQQLAQKGKKATLTKAMLRGVAKFIKMYLLKKGFMDGKNGLLLALVSSFGVFVKFAKLWAYSKESK